MFYERTTLLKAYEKRSKLSRSVRRSLTLHAETGSRSAANEACFHNTLSSKAEERRETRTKRLLAPRLWLLFEPAEFASRRTYPPSSISVSKASCETTGAISCSFSPSMRLMSFTPIVFLPVSRISLTRNRTICPPVVISMTSSSS